MAQFPVTPKVLEKLKEKNIDTYEKVARFFPLRYYDCRFENGLNSIFDGQMVCVIGKLTSINYEEDKNDKRKSKVKAIIKDRISGRNLRITWFGSYYIYREHRFGTNKTYMVYGVLKYMSEYNIFCMTGPIVFTDEIEDNMKLVPHYSKYSGISENTMNTIIQDSQYHHYEEYLPENIRTKYNLCSSKQLAHFIHNPSCPEEIHKAYKRIIFDDLLYFALGIKLKEKYTGKPLISIKTRKNADKIIENLPYKLTEDQKKVVNQIYDKMINQEKINALIQGDVSCGKTITMFLLAFIAVENGYQAAIMAPTDILAKQHYIELTKMLTDFKEYKAVYLSSCDTKKKQKEEILKQIETGECQFIVGTHSIATDQVKYNKLGLIAIDEEHRFGVEVKEKLLDKTDYDVPYITLSATPIPRSMAQLIYGGGGKQIFEIRALPNGRQNVDTFCYNKFDVPQIVEQQLNEGRQIYVVCPQINKDDEEKEQKIIRHSVEEVEEMYKKHFKNNSTIKIESITGGSKKGKNNSEEILTKFVNKEINILIATTVIEVGVNNPNASVIVIQDADCYGLSTLHQLRGRVKRGTYKPYCVLVSEKGLENPRLRTLCETEDGFKIAEKDFELRNAGNLLGLEQSGQNKYIELIKKYPNLYKKVFQIAEYMIQNNNYNIFMNYLESLEKSA